MTDLFGKPEQTRQQKTKASRKATGDLTRWAIDWMNDTLQFKVHRSNNIPSPIIKREKRQFEYQAPGELKEFRYHDEHGEIQIFNYYDFSTKVFEYDAVDIMFKKGNIKERILDISGIVLPYNGNDQFAGRHVEIEVKRGKDSLSPEQAERIEMLKKAGGITFVFDSEATFLHQIRPYMVERKLAF